MPKVKPGFAQKWVDRASVATEDYKTGVQNPRQSWSQATAGAENSYTQGVQKAISEKRFAKGVLKAGDSKWREGALTKGADRFASGVAAAKDRYQSQMQKVVAVIESTSLSPRNERGNENNYKRVADMGKALHQAKKDGKFN